MTLNGYASEIDDLAVDRGLIPAWETYYPHPEAWRSQFEAGKTPTQALDEDLNGALKIATRQQA